MQSHSEHKIADNGARVEIGTVTHKGRDYSALGSVVDHDNGIVVGYVASDNRTLTTWDGKPIGTVREVSKWATPHSFMSSHMHAYRAVIDGVHYHGRGGGSGLLLRLRRCK